ncbi:MAG: hypothetical protein II595_08710 [Desulfovibrio sp.]|jgi:nickel transport protein|nr:hypothetical protein [Desulfovibrio sp.]
MHTICRRAPLLLLALAVLLLSFQDAMAHRINIFAVVEADQLRVVCRFSKSSPARDCPVTVFNKRSNAKLAEARTSGEGIALIPVTAAMKSAPEGLRIHINAGEGHENDCFVEPAELALADTAPAGTIEAPAPQAAPAQAAPAAQAAGQHAGQPAGQALAGISHEELAKLIESSVERRVAPLRAMLAAEAERGPGMTEILGGIGWILGIFGTAALCLSRRGR